MTSVKGLKREGGRVRATRSRVKENLPTAALFPLPPSPFTAFKP